MHTRSARARYSAPLHRGGSGSRAARSNAKRRSGRSLVVAWTRALATSLSQRPICTFAAMAQRRPNHSSRSCLLRPALSARLLRPSTKEGSPLSFEYLLYGIKPHSTASGSWACAVPKSPATTAQINLEKRCRGRTRCNGSPSLRPDGRVGLCTTACQ